MDHKILTRDEIPEKYKWSLSDIFADHKQWDICMNEVNMLAKELSARAGTLNDAAGMLSCLNLMEKLGAKSLRVFAYARMRRDEDNANATYQEMTDRATRLITECGAASAFMTPEIIKIGHNTVSNFIRQEPKLCHYEHFFDDIFREQTHTLSESEEKLLAHTGEIAEASSDIYDMWSHADVRFGDIKDENGDMVELTHGRYTSFLESRNREVRRHAFDAMYAQYKAWSNTLSTTLSSNVKKNCFYAQTRHYDSAMEMSLSQDNIPCTVYNNLIDTIGRHIPELTRYLKLRKRALGLEELHMYDLYTPIVETDEHRYTYEEACKLVLSAVKPLGEQYVSDMQRAFDERWVDVYENRGKTSGAYSWGCHDVHPFVLLNFQGRIGDVFTLAHEMGHAMHSYYTNTTQPEVYKGYKIFVAEVASTVNENLLMEYLLRTSKDRNLRAYLLGHQLEEFRTTVFRQVMFAEFEREIHATYERGESLTSELLCDMYYKLNEKFFKAATVVDKDIAYEWARIPHFYSDFYVYQYATGFSAAVALANGILEDAGAAERYLKFLSGGDSKYPLELLREAGVDLLKPDPIDQALDSFARIIDELEQLIS